MWGHRADVRQLTVYHYKGGPCYRCVNPTPPPPAGGCSDLGVLGPVPGLIGCYQVRPLPSTVVLQPTLTVIHVAGSGNNQGCVWYRHGDVGKVGAWPVQRNHVAVL